MAAISHHPLRPTPTSRRNSGCFCSAFLLLLLTGCSSGNDGPLRVPVAGTVKLDGLPLEGAEVSLYADGEARVAITDNDGDFQIAGGAQVLQYKVVISKFEASGAVQVDAAAGMDSGQIQAMQMADGTGQTAAKIAKQLVPVKYSSRDKSELTLVVPVEGTQSADFELASQ